MGKKLSLLVLFFCCNVASLLAQAIVTPLQEDRKRQPIPRPVSGSMLRMQAAALTLPFFDDFSGTASSTPDPTRWINGGVYVNDRFSLRPVTRQVATFDGLDAQGEAYGTSTAGPTDTLTSQPLQLAALNPADSLYLSFYWQAGGLGDVPDLTNNNSRFLQLEFKDADGNWQVAWRQNGPGKNTEFAQVFVAVREGRYFHDQFQFRFRSEGARSGMLDVWNLDYIELDRGRRKGQNTTRDIGISSSVSPLLQHYTAMPARHFLSDPSAYLREEVTATVNNLGDMPGAIGWRGFIERVGNAAADTFLREQGLLPGQARQFEVRGTPRIDNVNLSTDDFTLQHGFFLDTKEQNAQQRANDTTLRKTHFADYFAYDDGTAEGGFSFISSQNTTQVAQRFDLNLPDQVRAFRIHFPRVGNELRNTSITFRIWSNNNGLPGRVLHEQAFQVQYTEGINTFYEVELSEPVSVEGSFFMGWSQPGTVFLNVGFDRNEQVPGRRFLFTPVDGWQEDRATEGTVMMRPIMTGQALGLEEIVKVTPVRVYPNPSNGKLHFTGPFEQLEIFDPSGKKVLHQKALIWYEPILLPTLAPGIYTVRIYAEKHIFTSKLILTNL